MEEKNIYDLIIIGGGPAGVTAGIYASRSNLKVAIIEEIAVGGQVNSTQEVDNYPGLGKISSMELCQKFNEHAEELNVEFVYDEVVACELAGEEKVVKTAYSGDYFAKTVIIASGARPRRLNLENEENLIGKGICFCAICDGMFFKNKDVVVMGGGNSAVEEAIYLSSIVKSVILINFVDCFQANAKLVEKLKSIENITYHLGYKVDKIVGEKKLEAIKFSKVDNSDPKEISVEGMFISIGRIPNSELYDVEKDKQGYIITDEDLKTNIEGVYAVGDVRQKKIRQIITACSDGAIASINCANYINAY